MEKEMAERKATVRWLKMKWQKEIILKRLQLNKHEQTFYTIRTKSQHNSN